jgi:hypothetical protein
LTRRRILQKNMAYPFVLALALKAHNIFPDVKEKETIVITHEKPTGNLAKRKLPDICRNLGLRPCRIIDLFKKEKWKIGG